MAGIKDILETEQSRAAADDWRKIHLFQEGNFYRAYEVSAWLCHLHISQFKVTHRHVKGIDQTIAFVGFPLSSLDKRKPEGAVVETVADKHIFPIDQLWKHGFLKRTRTGYKYVLTSNQ